MKKINKKATLGVGLAMFALADPTQVFNFNNSTLDSTVIKVETQTSYVKPEAEENVEGSWSSDYTSYTKSESNELVKDEQVTIGGYNYYFNESGVKVTGLYTDGDDSYYYDPAGTGSSNGRMVSGKVTIDDDTYYFSTEDGKMVKKQAIEDGSSIYYFGEDGKMVTSAFATVESVADGIEEIEGSNEYYFDESGKLVKSGFVTITDEEDEDVVSTYYINSEDHEKLTSKFKTISKATYYFGSDGKMATGITAIESETDDADKEDLKYSQGTYYFGTDGKMVTGLVNVSKVEDYDKSGIYYFNTKGLATSGWQVVGSDRYYFDKESFKATIGEFTDEDADSAEYYFDENGVMVTGFYTLDGATYYYSEETLTLGQKVKGKTVKINGIEYTFDENGKMATGFKDEDGKYYYYNEEGQRVTGWFTVADKTYYALPKTGEVQTGFVKIEGTTYYFATATSADSTKLTKGEMLKGIQTISKVKYFLGENTGRLVTGWVTADKDGKNYYMDSKGVIQTGWQTIDGSTYYLGTDGAMVTGLQEITTSSSKVTGKYYFGNDGIMRVGFQNVDGYTYYFDEKFSTTLGNKGKMLTGVVEINGEEYYLDSVTGKVVTGWLTLGKESVDDIGTTYYMNSRGIVQKGFVTIDGTTYYFDEKTGVLGHGLTTINGDLYFLGENTGRVVTGLVTADAKDKDENRKVFYMNERGIVQTGFITVGGTTYYFEEDGDNDLSAETTKGQMLRGIQEINGKNYFLGENTGRVVTGWITADMKDKNGNNMIFYMNERGIIQTGFQTIDGTTYYFATATSSVDSGEKVGQMLKGIQKISGVNYFLGENTGRVVTGLVTADMKDKSGERMIFYMNRNGEIQTGFQTINGTAYYFATATSSIDSGEKVGQMLKGIQTITSGKVKHTYFLGENTGRVVTGWITADKDGERYYMDEYGVIQTGLKTIGENDYYFDEKGVMQKNTVVEVDGTAGKKIRYTIDSDGVITKTTEVEAI